MTTKADIETTDETKELHTAIEMAACDLVAGARAVYSLTKEPWRDSSQADAERNAVNFVAEALLGRAEGLLSAMDTVKPMADRLSLLAGEA